MYILSEDGTLEEDLSADPLIPYWMGSGSVTVKRGKIYTVGNNRIEHHSGGTLKEFDGNQW